VTDPRPVPSEATAVIAAEGLEVRYQGGPDPAVRGVTLRLEPGQGLLLRGPSGSGKTSLLRGLLGLVPATGPLRVLGGPPGAPESRGRVGYGPQGGGFASGLTVVEAVGAVAALRRGGARRGMAEDALGRAGLGLVARWRTARLDAEGWRRLSLAMGVAGDPELVVLDDPWLFPETLREIAAARARGGAVLATSAWPGGLAPALGGRIDLGRDGVAR
jgi:ABC-type multidrug transport system ATPase subunit